MKYKSLIIKTKVMFLWLYIFAGCEKRKQLPAVPPPTTTSVRTGLPSNLKNINGYLYSGLEGNYNFSYAVFNDPGGRLLNSLDHLRWNIINPALANIDVGAVRNDSLLHKNNTGKALYYANTRYSLNNLMSWKIEGNLTFKPFDIHIPRGLPSLTVAALPSSVSKSLGLTIPADSIASNFDSLTVRIMGYDGQGAIRKTALPGEILVFNSTDLSNIPITTVGGILIYAYNYSHQIIENKIYVFEYSCKDQKYPVSINP